MMGGRRLTEKGWKTYVGPGRHVLGSNYFWYFKTPCGGAMELACDMDYVDDNWEAKEWEYSHRCHRRVVHELHALRTLISHDYGGTWASTYLTGESSNSQATCPVSRKGIPWMVLRQKDSWLVPPTDNRLPARRVARAATG